MAAKKTVKYVVVEDFKDLQDKNKVYRKDDTYPNPANKKVDDKRLKDLLSANNKQNRPVIKEAEEEAPAKDKKE